MTYVRETSAAKSVAAYVVLNAKGAHVATVQMHFGASRVLVNVWNEGREAQARTLKALGLTVDDKGRVTEGKRVGETIYDVAGIQEGRASGYGYDKRTAALAGLVIDGHVMTDHCSGFGAPKPPKGRQTWPGDATPPKGYTFANYRAHAGNGDDLPDAERGYANCYRRSGLDYLEALGYRVIQAL